MKKEIESKEQVVKSMGKVIASTIEKNWKNIYSVSITSSKEGEENRLHITIDFNDKYNPMK